MQARKADKICTTKTKMRFLTGLCLLCCSLLFPVVSAQGRPFGGVIVQTTINLNGQRTVFDSFDSSNPGYSFWRTNWYFNGVNYGTYTNTRRTDQITLGTDSNLVQMDEAAIYGYVDTGPGVTVSIGGGGTCGDLAWIGSNPSSPINSGIEPGHLFDDMNVTFNDAVLPMPTNIWYGTNWLTLTALGTSTNIGGISYNYVITNIIGKPGTPTNRIYWKLNSLSKGNSLLVNASNVVLYLPGGIAMKSGDNLSVNTNSSVEIYSGAPIDTGNGLVNNTTQYAPAFQLYGLPGCTSIAFGGNSALTMWLYAPRASVSFNGGGSSAYDVVGAFMCHDLTVNGHYNFHFDQVLSTNIPNPPSVSLSPSNQAVQLASGALIHALTGGDSPLYYQWFFDQTNLIAADTNLNGLLLTNIQFSDAGSYSVIVTNAYGSVTSAPASLIVYSNATPTLTIDSASTNGQFQFDILGVTGLNYTVQASSNLIDWVPLQTNVSPFTFVDTNSTAFPQRFYRSVWMH